MASGPSKVNSTTTQEPPSYLQPLLQTAGAAALGGFTGQGTEIATGTTGVPQKKLNYFQKKFGDDLTGANPQQRARMKNKFGIDFQTIGGAPGYSGPPLTDGNTPFQGPVQAGGTAGTDRDYSMPNSGANLIGQGQNLVSQTLQGDFLSPTSNPYLEAQFNQGADLITNRLNTSFARSGRDLAAGRPAAADELGNFAANLYGNAYNFERGMQQNALNQAQGYDPLNLFINRLAGIVPNAGGVVSSQQPVFKTGLF